MIEQIVSGGQTGVDQAALLIAKELGIPIGGWCPKGGFDENQQCVSGKYSLREASTENPDERTRLNIDDSDGTLIIVPSLPMPDHITDGTNLTISYAEEQNKLYILRYFHPETFLLHTVQSNVNCVQSRGSKV